MHHQKSQSASAKPVETAICSYASSLFFFQLPLFSGLASTSQLVPMVRPATCPLMNSSQTLTLLSRIRQMDIPEITTTTSLLTECWAKGNIISTSAPVLYASSDLCTNAVKVYWTIFGPTTVSFFLSMYAGKKKTVL